MDIKSLQEIIVDALDDIKARDIVVFDTTKGTAEFDRVIIATADVARQTKAMALNVIDKVKQHGGRIVSMEGGDGGEWVLVDCADAIVHIMQPAVRQYYNLEELWGQKKVKVMTVAEKAAEAAKKVIEKARAVKLPPPAVSNAATRRKTVKPAAKKAAPKPVKTKVTSVPAGVVAKKKVESGKAAPKKAVSKKAAPKKTALKKVAAKKIAPEKAAGKKVAGKKTAPGKTVVRKAR